MTQRGMTLVEVLIATTLLVGGGTALMLGMQQSVVHAEYLSQFQVAMNAAQGELEELSSVPIDMLWAGNAYLAARGTGMCVGIGEDSNCNGLLDAGEDANGNGALDSPIPNGRLGIWIRQPLDDAIRNPGDPELLDIHVAACWQHRGRPIGEDQNCNGQMDAGEDVNGDGWMTSPAMVSLRIGRRD